MPKNYAMQNDNGYWSLLQGQLCDSLVILSFTIEKGMGGYVLEGRVAKSRGLGGKV